MIGYCTDKEALEPLSSRLSSKRKVKINHPPYRPALTHLNSMKSFQNCLPTSSSSSAVLPECFHLFAIPHTLAAQKKMKLALLQASCSNAALAIQMVLSHGDTADGLDRPCLPRLELSDGLGMKMECQAVRQGFGFYLCSFVALLYFKHSSHLSLS